MKTWQDESNRDRFDDARPPSARLADRTADLQQLLREGRLTAEEYEERMIELLEEEQDVRRAQDLEHEQFPGELEESDDDASG